LYNRRHGYWYKWTIFTSSMIRCALISILFIITLVSAEAQTCCSAGAPVASNFGLKTSTKYKHSLSLAYRHIGINRLVDNNETLVNDPRTRENNILSLGANYTFSEKFALGVLLPLVAQNRTTISESQSAFGIGDLSLVAQLKIWSKNDWLLQYTPALKMPTGTESIRSERNIFLSPDMQSGTGSWDVINQLILVKNRIFNSAFSAKTNVSFRLNGTNSNFASDNGVGGRSFKFGNELNWRTTISREFLAGQWFIIPDLEWQYRWADSNSEQNAPANNSGGNWVNQILGIYFTRDNIISYRTFIKFPLYQNLEGVQITTNLEWGAQINYQF